MKRRSLAVLAVVVVAWLAIANTVHGKARSADWTRPRVMRAPTGTTAFYPRAWHAEAEGWTTLVIWSQGKPADRSAERENRIPAGGVWIWLMGYGPMARTDGFEPRPRHFELRDEDLGFQSCGFGFEGWNLSFVDHGQALQAIIGLGPGARPEDATQVLDRLVIRPPRIRSAT